MENKNCDMCTMPNCISRNLSSKEDCLLDKKLSANDSFDFLEQSLAKFAIDFAYKGKTLKECLDKYKSNIIAAAHTIEPTISDIVDEHWWEMLGEKPVSNKMGGINNALIQDILAMKSVDEAMAEVEEKAKAFTEAHKDESSEQLLAEMRGEDSVSEDLEEVAHQYYKPNETFMDGFKKGANWQKQRDNIPQELVDAFWEFQKVGGDAVRDFINAVNGYNSNKSISKDLDASNPLTWEDVKEICVQSVLVEIDLGGKVSDERHYTEVLKRFKAQKGKEV